MRPPARTPTIIGLAIYGAAVLSAALLKPATGARAQTPHQAATLSFHLERQGLAVPVYTLTVHEDGSGTYDATYLPPPPRYSRPGYMPPAQQVSMPLALLPRVAADLFEKARATGGFHLTCASRARNIADTGLKTLVYRSAEGEGTCTFNYTEDKRVASLSETFQAMASALDQARQMDRDHQYDRLALDAEVKQLVETVHDGRAAGLSNITTTLQTLVDDPQVLERVRTQAAKLIELSKLGK